MISQSYQRSNHPTSLLQGTGNGVCCTACEMPCIKQKSFQRGKTQLINGSPALTPTARPSFLDSATDLGKKITQEKVYPHVAFHGLHCTNQTHLQRSLSCATTPLPAKHERMLSSQRPAEEMMFCFFRYYKTQQYLADSLSLHTTVLRGVEKHKGEAHHVS